MFESVVACKGFLEANPKWRTWQDEEDSREETGKKRSRPSGTKAAKQKEADKKIIQGFLSGSSVDGTAIETLREKHNKETKIFMQGVAGSLASFANAFSQQMEQANRLASHQMEQANRKMEHANKLALLPHLSPKKRAKLAEEMYRSGTAAAVVAGPQVINTATGGSSVESQLSGMGNSNSTSADKQKTTDDCFEVDDDVVELPVNKEVNKEVLICDKNSDSDSSSSSCHSPAPRTVPTRKLRPCTGLL